MGLKPLRFMSFKSVTQTLKITVFQSVTYERHCGTENANAKYRWEENICNTSPQFHFPIS